MACVMAGCEYLENIERVGLKIALKFFDKFKTFEKVIEEMKTHKTYKDRIKDDYEQQALKAAQLFMFQTVSTVRGILK